MTNQKEKESSHHPQFTREELEALQEIVKDWLNLEPLSPPFPDAVQSALKKVGIAEFLEGPELETVRRATRPPVRTD
jgi:hypothetical protein